MQLVPLASLRAVNSRSCNVGETIFEAVGRKGATGLDEPYASMMLWAS